MVFERFLKEAQLSPDILKSNFKLEIKHRTALPEFYEQILDVWSQLGITYPNQKDMYVWYNNNIRIGHDMVYYRNFQDIGLNYVEFLKWYGLIQATRDHRGPSEHREQSNEELVYTVNVNDRSIPIEKVVSKNVYMLLIEKHDLLITSKPRTWGKIEDKNVDWENVYLRPYRKSIDTKSRIFQYKFLNDILVNNYWLYKWSIKDTDKCSFCQSQTETLEHMFWNCKHTQAFWEQIKIWFVRKTQFDITIDKTMVFLGSDDDITYTVILEAKKHIYYSRLNNVKPTFVKFLNWLEYVKNLEIYVARRSNSSKLSSRTLEKWSLLENIS